jgi:multidrug efflux pump subunit AcrA (membrane-fusion protein)
MIFKLQHLSAPLFLFIASCGHSHETPGHSHETSGPSHETSDHSHETSDHSHETSDHSHETSDHSHETSDHSHETPGPSHETSDHSHETPGPSHETSDHSHETPHDHPHTDSESPQKSQVQTNRISVPATVRRNLGITFARVEFRRVAQTLRIPGVFELQPRARREYRLPLPGRVELLVNHLDRVEAGEQLYRYQSPKWPELLHEIILGEQGMETAEAQIFVAEASLNEARTMLEVQKGRLDALREAQASNAELESQAAQLEASLPRLEGELQLAYTQLENSERTREHALHRASTASGIPSIDLVKNVETSAGTAPAYTTIDWIVVNALGAGVVEALHITDGSFADAPTLVISTADPSDLRFRAQALQADLPLLQSIGQALIVPSQVPGLSADAGIASTLQFGLEAHPEQRSTTLFATPSALASWVRPGVSAFLEIETRSTDSPALAIPSSAILRDGLQHIFFRQDPSDPDQVIRVFADLGLSDGRWTVIRSGLQETDQVVLSGAYELKLGIRQDTADAQEGGHIHSDGTTHSNH